MPKKQKKSSQQQPHAILNRRARFDYELGEEIVAGMVLNGNEARAARLGHVQLKGAFVTIRNNELWLNNASFTLAINERGKPNARTVDTTARKLLASRKQINALADSKQQGLTIIPTKLLTQGKFIKLVIALGKGKKLHDKRETIKRRDIEREHKRQIRI